MYYYTKKPNQSNPSYEHAGLVSLFNSKDGFGILVEEQQWCYVTHNWKNKGFYTFLKGISPKANVIMQLELKFAYYDITIQHMSYYAIETPTESVGNKH